MKYCHVTLTGNLVADPEMRTSNAGKVFANLRIVTGRDKNPVFIDVTLFEKTAETACNYLTKGSPVLISGELVEDTWQDNNGQKRSKIKVVGNQLRLFPKSASAPTQSTTEEAADDEEIPF